MNLERGRPGGWVWLIVAGDHDYNVFWFSTPT
jgi:hypothetical protein